MFLLNTGVWIRVATGKTGISAMDCIFTLGEVVNWGEESRMAKVHAVVKTTQSVTGSRSPDADLVHVMSFPVEVSPWARFTGCVRSALAHTG